MSNANLAPADNDSEDQDIQRPLIFPSRPPMSPPPPIMELFRREINSEEKTTKTSKKKNKAATTEVSKDKSSDRTPHVLGLVEEEVLPMDVAVSGPDQEIATNSEKNSLAKAQEHVEAIEKTLQQQHQAAPPHRESTIAHTASQTNQESSSGNIPPIVALEKEMADEREQSAEKQKEIELRQDRAFQRMMRRQKRDQERTEEEQEARRAKERAVTVDLDIDKEATSEKIFDRRHEVLDSQAQQPRLEAHSLAGPKLSENAPVSISQVLSERSYQSSTSVASDNSSELNSASQEANAGEIYRKSLRTGFFVGLTIIILGVITYLTF